jgi:hypothetical protein
MDTQEVNKVINNIKDLGYRNSIDQSSLYKFDDITLSLDL